MPISPQRLVAQVRGRCRPKPWRRCRPGSLLGPRRPMAGASAAVLAGASAAVFAEAGASATVPAGVSALAAVGVSAVAAASAVVGSAATLARHSPAQGRHWKVSTPAKVCAGIPVAPCIPIWRTCKSCSGQRVLLLRMSIFSGHVFIFAFPKS